VCTGNHLPFKPSRRIEIERESDREVKLRMVKPSSTLARGGLGIETVIHESETARERTIPKEYRHDLYKADFLIRYTYLLGLSFGGHTPRA